MKSILVNRWRDDLRVVPEFQTGQSSSSKLTFSTALALAQTQQMRSGAQNEEADKYAGRDDQKQNG